MHSQEQIVSAPNFSSSREKWQIPLGECDCYLYALEEYMRSKGQGRHIGVTILELGPCFCLETFKTAVQRFATAYPILFAYIHRSWLAGLPEWRPLPPGEIEITMHPAGSNPNTVATARLRGEWAGSLCFDVVQDDLHTVLLMSWAHLLFDGRGAELVLLEINHFATSASHRGTPKKFWGFPPKKPQSLLRELQAVRPFAKHHSGLRRSEVRALGVAPALSGTMQFQLLRFSEEETLWIYSKAEEITGGIFFLPYFLAIVMRAHAEILESRGISAGTLECAVSAQLRKRGTLGAIFQNQVSQLFFSLPLEKAWDIQSASAALKNQFTEMNKSRLDKAFLVMAGWMRRLPNFFYKFFISRSASGNIASFYYAHTGSFLPSLHQFCGAKIIDGWHIPSVFQPPGTGIFFSDRSGRLTCSVCWRSGAVTEHELARLVASLREGLLAGFCPA